MTPCGARTVTPRMIRNGHVAIGDRIQLEEEMTHEEQTKYEGPDSEEKQMAANASSTQRIPDSVLVQSAGLNIISKKDESEKSESDNNEEVVVANAQTTNISNQSSSIQSSGSSASAGSRENAVSVQSSQPKASTQGNTSISRTQIPTTPLRSDMGYSAPSVFSLESLPLVYEQMTEYAEHLNDLASETPTFNVPSSPMVPPQYDQSIDYDSIQYLNGFLTTQIGRFIKVEQLVSTNIVTSRSGFLIGVGNNYIILQEITTGNIMAVDYYSIKYVYVYYSQPIFPEINHPSTSE